MPSPPGRRGLLAVVALLAVALVIGAVVVAKSASGPAAAQAGSGGGGVGGVKAESIEAALAAAQVYVRDGQYAEATTILEKLVQRAPTDQTAHVVFAQALRGQDKHAEAYREFEAAIALNQSAPVDRATAAATGQRDPVTAQLHFEAGTCANKINKIDRAIEHYWMAQTLDNTEPRYPLFLGMMQIKSGDESAANASLLRATHLKPDLAEAWGTLAELAARKNQLGIAAQHLAEARKLQPEVTRWRILEARILNREGEPEKAATILLALDPQTRAEKQVVTLLAESYGLLKKPLDAANLWANAAKLNASDAEYHYQAALWFQRAGDPAKAAASAKTAAMLGHEGAKQLVTELAQP